jgi:RNA polymerase sigma-70 factor, ECF subfamily
LKIQGDCVAPKRQPDCLFEGMICETPAPGRFAANGTFPREAAIVARFLDEPRDESFTGLYELFAPRLVAFYRARKCDPGLSEDLAQLVMFTVYCKAGQIRDRGLFPAWLFRIAHNALCRHYGKREVDTVYLEDSVVRGASVSAEPGPPAFEFMRWMGFLNPREREVMTLRFVEQWEYHEIAAAKDMPIGTVQSIVFNAKKKLAPRLTAIDHRSRQERKHPKPAKRAGRPNPSCHR